MVKSLLVTFQKELHRQLHTSIAGQHSPQLLMPEQNPMSYGLLRKLNQLLQFVPLSGHGTLFLDKTFSDLLRRSRACSSQGRTHCPRNCHSCSPAEVRLLDYPRLSQTIGQSILYTSVLTQKANEQIATQKYMYLCKLLQRKDHKVGSRLLKSSLNFKVDSETCSLYQWHLNCFPFCPLYKRINNIYLFVSEE